MQPAAQKPVRIERPRGEQTAPSAPRRIEAKPRALAVEMASASSESVVEDDLEIPAFLRRRAN
jgi:cell division protein FtsZ